MTHDGTADDFRILHEWVCDTILPILKTSGMWAAPDPAPLSGVQVTEAFKIICEHPNYEGQTLMTRHRDGLTVCEDGHIRTERV